MATILDFHRIAGPAIAAQSQEECDLAQRRSRQPLDEERDDYWPEVSSGLWVASGSNQPRKENSPERVLTEMGLILGIAALLVVVTTVLLGAPV